MLSKGGKRNEESNSFGVSGRHGAEPDRLFAEACDGYRRGDGYCSCRQFFHYILFYYWGRLRLAVFLRLSLLLERALLNLLLVFLAAAVQLGEFISLFILVL